MPEYLTHKVVNISAVVKKNRKDIAYYEKHYEAQAKYDGCFAFVHLSDYCGSHVTSRTGEHFGSMDGHALQLYKLLKDEVKFNKGLVLLAEAWSPDMGQNDISGSFRRGGRTAWELRLVLFDCLTSEEYSLGRSDVPYADRMGRLSGKLTSQVWYSPDPDRSYILAHRASRWAPGTYDALHLTSQLVDDPEGYDGLILADPEGTWTAGRGTTGEKVRLKKTLSFDLRVTGVHEGVGEKTGRAVYTLTVDYKGKSLGVGSGLPHDFDRVPKVGDIVEIHAMDYSSDGLLREPRYKGIRFDKECAD